MGRRVRYLSLLGEVPVWWRRRLIEEGRWRRRLRVLELVPATPSPSLPVLLWSARPRTSASPSSRHGVLHNLRKALPLPLPPDCFSVTQLQRCIHPLIILPHWVAITNLEGFRNPQISSNPHKVHPLALPNPSWRCGWVRFGDKPQLSPEIVHLGSVLHRAVGSGSPSSTLGHPHPPPVTLWLRGCRLSALFVATSLTVLRETATWAM